MPERETWHVTTHDEESWQVKKAGNEQATQTHDTKDDAIQAAKSLAKNQKLGQVKVHRTDGTIHQEFTYGEDPPGTKG